RSVIEGCGQVGAGTPSGLDLDMFENTDVSDLLGIVIAVEQGRVLIRRDNAAIAVEEQNRFGSGFNHTGQELAGPFVRVLRVLGCDIHQSDGEEQQSNGPLST